MFVHLSRDASIVEVGGLLCQQSLESWATRRALVVLSDVIGGFAIHAVAAWNVTERPHKRNIRVHLSYRRRRQWLNIVGDVLGIIEWCCLIYNAVSTIVAKSKSNNVHCYSHIKRLAFTSKVSVNTVTRSTEVQQQQHKADYQRREAIRVEINSDVDSWSLDRPPCCHLKTPSSPPKYYLTTALIYLESFGGFPIDPFLPRRVQSRWSMSSRTHRTGTGYFTDGSTDASRETRGFVIQKTTQREMLPSLRDVAPHNGAQKEWR